VTLKLEDKKAIVAQVNEVAMNAQAVVAAEYRGLTVAQMTKLRTNARNQDIYVKVVPNNLARRAFEGTSFACMQDALVGPLLLAFSKHEPGAAARLVRDFAKENEQLVVKSLAFDGQLYGASDLNRFANLPTRNEAISLLMSVLKAPVTKFVRTMVEPHAKFVRTVKAVGDKQQ
jgi:large subunit ribosomal protein L10